MIYYNGKMIKNISAASITEDLKGELLLSFSVYKNDDLFDLLENEKSVYADGRRFIIKVCEAVKTRKDIVAVSEFYELNDEYVEGVFGGTRKLEDFLRYLLNGTGWTFESDVDDYELIANVGDTSPTEGILNLIKLYGCDMLIMPNKHLKFAKRLNADLPTFVYRYGVNIADFKKVTNTDTLKTQIVGYGSNGLKVTYTSPNASIFGIRKATPISDDRYVYAASMEQRLKKELEGIDTPAITLDMKDVTLKELPLGQIVQVIYEPLKLNFSTRIIAKNKKIRNGKWVTNDNVIGNKTASGVSDDFINTNVSINENNKEIRSRLEQTNERIEAAIESTEGEIASIVIELNKIETRVQENEDKYATLTVEVNKIELDVSDNYYDLNGKINNTNANLAVTNNEIALKVDKNGVIGAINLSSETARIEANNIELRGAVTVLSDITDGLGDIKTGNIDIYEDVKIGRNLYMRGSGVNTLYFADFTYIHSDGGGSVAVRAYNDLTLDGNKINIHGTLDLTQTPNIIYGSNLPVFNFGNVGGLAYSSSGNSLWIRDAQGNNLARIATTPV